MKKTVEPRRVRLDRRQQLNRILMDLAEGRLGGLASLSDEEFQSWLGHVLPPEDIETLLDATREGERDRQ